MIGWFADFEKQEALADFCKGYSGQCYFYCGVHPDNIDRTHKKNQDGWIEKVEEISKRSECVGILSGLNVAREIVTHFAQESLLRSSCHLAEKIQLPLVLHIANEASLDRALEILAEESWLPSSGEAPSKDKVVILHDAITACGSNVEKVKSVVALGVRCMLSGNGICDGDEAIRLKAQQCVKEIPLGNLLSSTDAPWRTPQV
jgi:Tat protein secretion system quality control protein TatD with DNase activity